MTADDTPLPRQQGVTQRVEFPDGVTINDYWGGSLSVWCEQFNANFGSVTFPSSLDCELDSAEPSMPCGKDATDIEEPLSSDSSRTSLTLGLLTALQLAVCFFGGALVF